MGNALEQTRGAVAGETSIGIYQETSRIRRRQEAARHVKLKDSDINHLRRLLGYVRCEIGQSPQEFKDTLRAIAPAVGTPSPEAYGRLLETYERAQRVPAYVRAAVKALEKVLAVSEDETLEAHITNVHTALEIQRLALPAPTVGEQK